MKKTLFILLALPGLAVANICENIFQRQGTTVNNYDTTEWLEIKPYIGFFCDMDLKLNRTSSQGDYAYFQYDYDQSVNRPDFLYHKFTFDLRTTLESFQDGDRVSLFQVRSSDPVESRMLNIHLFKRVDVDKDDLSLTHRWELKVVWFKPYKDSFVKTVNFYDLSQLGTTRVSIDFAWDKDDYDYIRINNVKYNSPYLLLDTIYPLKNWMGLINTNTQLQPREGIAFTEVVPYFY